MKKKKIIEEFLDVRYVALKDSLDEAVKKQIKSPRTRDTYLAIAKKLLTGALTASEISSRSHWLQIAGTLRALRRCKAIDTQESFGLDVEGLADDYCRAESSQDAAETIGESILSPEEFQRVLAAIPTTKKGNELRLACRFSRESGVRLSEALALRPEHFEQKDEQILVKVVNGKGRKSRTTYLPCSFLSELAKFSGFTISRQYANYTIYRAMKAAKVKSSFHGLRHTFATEQMQHGMNPYELAAILGHSDIKTTMIYAHVEKKAPASMVALWKKRGLA